MFSDMLTELQDSISDSSREVLTRYLNRAYKELYDTYDLPNSVVDEFFAIDSQDGQIVLPEYVDQIRGAGSRMDYVPISISDFRSGYRVTPSFQQPYEWRIRGEVPLVGQLDATDKLRITLFGPETSAVNVTIIGETAQAATHTEIVTLLAGETSALTEAQWVADNPYAMTSITKDITTQNDIAITVASTGKEVSRIRNRLLKARYQLFQLTDLNPLLPAGFWLGPPGAQIVYKKTLIPLVFDTDEIIYPKAESSVCWKAREIWYQQKSDQASFAASEQAKNKCLELLNNIMINQESAGEKKVKFGRNPYDNGWRFTRGRGLRYGNYYGYNR
jgi:hypothetical protein